jgi:hypothetical protein
MNDVKRKALPLEDARQRLRRLRKKKEEQKQKQKHKETRRTGWLTGCAGCVQLAERPSRCPGAQSALACLGPAATAPTGQPQCTGDLGVPPVAGNEVQLMPHGHWLTPGARCPHPISTL